jgi:hypothetical protein
MSAPRTRVPQIHVEQLASGALSPERAQAVRRALEAEPGGMERLEAIAASNAEILRELPPERVAREVRARVAEQGWRGRRLARTWLPLVAVAAAVVMAVGINLDDPAAPTPEERGTDVRIKGLDPDLRVYRDEGGQVEQLANDAVAHEGDLLQLAYVATAGTHGVILSLDGQGVVTLHHPADAASSTSLEAGREVRLPHAYELDDAPRFERFFLLTSDRPIDVQAAIDRAERQGVDGAWTLEDGQTLRAVELRLRKDPRP